MKLPITTFFRALWRRERTTLQIGTLMARITEPGKNAHSFAENAGATTESDRRA